MRWAAYPLSKRRTSASGSQLTTHSQLPRMFTGVFKDRTRSRLGPPRTPDLVLGKLLQARSLAPAVFQRRATLGPFVVDYVCMDRALVVELDDANRGTPGGGRVDARERFLNQLGFRVLRVRRAEVLEEPAQVITKVRSAFHSGRKASQP